MHSVTVQTISSLPSEHTVRFGELICSVLFFSGHQPPSNRCWKIRSFWSRGSRRRKYTSCSRSGKDQHCHRGVCGWGQQWLHWRPFPLLLQPRSAAGWTPGGVPAVPAQPAAFPLPTPQLLFSSGVLRLPSPIPAHRDIREQGEHCMPAVPRGVGAAGCPCHSRWPGTAGEIWGVPAEAFSGCRPRYTLVPGTWLQVRAKL